METKLLRLLTTLGLVGTLTGLVVRLAAGDSAPLLIELYYLGLLGALTFVSWRARPLETSEARPGLRLTLAVFAVVLAWRLLMLGHVSVLIDEETFFGELGQHYPVAAAWDMHQTPLAYSLAELWQWPARHHLFALRFPAALESALAAVVFFRLAYGYSRKRSAALLFTALFAAHALIVQSGWEGRTLGLAVLTLVLTVAMMARGSWVWAWIAAQLCVLSIGLQPPLLFVALGVVALPLFRAWSREGFKAWWHRVGPLAVAVVALLPLQLAIVAHAPPRFGKLVRPGSPGLFEALSSYGTFRTAFEQQAGPLLAVAALLLGVLAFAALRARQPVFRRIGAWREGAWLLAGGLLFLVGVSLLFAVAIDWMLNDYYLTYAWPCLVLGLARISAELSAGEGARGGALATGCIVLAAFLAQFADTSPVWRLTPATDPRWPDEQTALNLLPRKKGVTAVQPVCAVELTRFCPAWIIGGSYYLKSSDEERYEFPGDASRWMRDFYLGPTEPTRLVIFYQSLWSGELPLPELGDTAAGATILKSHGVTLVVLEGPQVRARALRLLERFRERAREALGSESYVIYPTLIWAHLGQGEVEKARALWAELKPLLPESPLIASYAVGIDEYLDQK